MSEGRMEINFKESLEAAEILEEVARLLAKAADQDFCEAITGIRRGWEGAGAEMFLKKGDIMFQKLKQSADALSTRAEAVRRAAGKIYEAERRAIMLAHDRKYN